MHVPVLVQQQFDCNDLSFTAYLMTMGATLLQAKKLGGLYVFSLELNGLNVTTLKVQFANSEIAKFDQAVKNLKKIIYSGRTRH
jgi:hypothetical protein